MPELKGIDGGRTERPDGTAVEHELPTSVSVLCAVLFGGLLSLAFILGDAGSEELGKWVGVAGICSPFVVLAYRPLRRRAWNMREAGTIPDGLIVGGILAALVGLCAAGIWLANAIFGWPLPWALAGIIPVFVLLYVLVIVIGVVTANRNSKLDENEGCRYE